MSSVGARTKRPRSPGELLMRRTCTHHAGAWAPAALDAATGNAPPLRQKPRRQVRKSNFWLNSNSNSNRPTQCHPRPYWPQCAARKRPHAQEPSERGSRLEPLVRWERTCARLRANLRAANRRPACAATRHPAHLCTLLAGEHRPKSNKSHTSMHPPMVFVRRPLARPSVRSAASPKSACWPTPGLWPRQSRPPASASALALASA